MNIALKVLKFARTVVFRANKINNSSFAKCAALRNLTLILMMTTICKILKSRRCKWSTQYLVTQIISKPQILKSKVTLRWDVNQK